MGMIFDIPYALLCLAGLFLLALLFDFFTVLLGNVIRKHTNAKRNNVGLHSSESMDDDGFVYAAMYLSMHDE